MTYTKYIEMCNMYGDTPDLSKAPPEYGDFPYYVHVAYEIFQSLPDTYSSGSSAIMYTGKDYGALEILFKIYLVDEEDHMKVFEVIKFLDSRARKQAIAQAGRKTAK